MSEDDVITAKAPSGFVMYQPPKGSGWRCTLFGPHGISWEPSEGELPNRFHRFMARALIGAKWEKIKGGAA